MDETNPSQLGVGIEKSKPQAGSVGGGNREQQTPTAKERLKKTDPRDYFRTTTFQKHARNIDADPTHLWEVEPDSYTWSNDPGCEVTIATVYNSETKQQDLLLAAKATEGEPVAACLTSLEPSVRDFASYTASLVAKRFPVTERLAFVQNLVKIAPELAKLTPDQAALQIASHAVNLLPDYPTTVSQDLNIDLPRVSYGEPEPSALQRTDLRQFLRGLMAKMPPEKFQASLSQFIDNIPFTDHIYGRNFKYIFSDALGWMVASRPDTKINDSFPEATERAATFPIGELVKRQINSDDELRAVLAEMPVKSEPETSFMRAGLKMAELIDPEKVVGGSGITDWSVVSTSEGRGLEQIKRFTDGFSNGTIDISGRNSPINVEEVNGDYYIGRDGRHRIAALKALGIPFVPMMVTHFN